MATAHLGTGTAADLLTFEKFNHLERGERLTRVATANQDWIVQDWDGEKYVVKFTNNFSKKHLFTFSKKVEKTKAKAELEAQKPGQAGQDAENWRKAEYALLLDKIIKNLDKRAVAGVCNCTHQYTRHLHPNVPPPGKHPGPCLDCACAGFATPYGLARRYVHKPTEDPLSGASTTKNTCLILNWVPREEFERVVVQSIQAEEKPPGWTRGHNLAVPVGPGPASEKHLKWDFGLARRGAIIVAQKNVAAGTFTFTNFQGCWIGARKIGSEIGKQTWEVYHMLTDPAHLPF